ncbi:hypothetical protein HLB23_20025 [Nocardia uniformis]|uniref:Uncharacterized protein n=1 Tax=Nocardia uniformis TaxID=53432 RepID=A0A849C303_9NOCA|nr:hypothetical protein [Nocardia uniformis]NNH72118.1 hypothetical protein [Nocardia uniformis]
MSNGDGLMKHEGAENVLRILGQYSRSAKPVRDSIDLDATYTNEFVEQALKTKSP